MLILHGSLELSLWQWALCEFAEQTRETFKLLDLSIRLSRYYNLLYLARLLNIEKSYFH